MWRMVEVLAGHFEDTCQSLREPALVSGVLVGVPNLREIRANVCKSVYFNFESTVISQASGKARALGRNYPELYPHLL